MSPKRAHYPASIVTQAPPASIVTAGTAGQHRVQYARSLAPKRAHGGGPPAGIITRVSVILCGGRGLGVKESGGCLALDGAVNRTIEHFRGARLHTLHT